MCKVEGQKVGKDYWDKLWKADERKSFTYRLLNRIIGSAVNRRLKLVFKKYLPREEKSILEIGCALGGWLVCFNREFGYDVYGIDYSEAGCELARENLRRNEVKGEIICGDAFDTSFQNKYQGFFDIVYSLGFIEHFDDPSEALELHLRLLKTDGLLMMTMPNYGDGSIYRKWTRLTRQDEDLVRTHNVELMEIANFKRYLDRFKNIEIQTLRYVGPTVIPFGAGLIGRLFNGMIGYLTFFVNSKTFSSQIVSVARKR